MTGSGGSPRLVGTVVRSGDAFVDLTVRGPVGEWTLACVVDTGYAGELALPEAVVSRLRLRHIRWSTLRLADGTRVIVNTYVAEVDWLLNRRRVHVDALPGHSSLIGSALLTPHQLAVDYAQRTVEIR